MLVSAFTNHNRFAELSVEPDISYDGDTEDPVAQVVTRSKSKVKHKKKPVDVKLDVDRDSTVNIVNKLVAEDVSAVDCSTAAVERQSNSLDTDTACKSVPDLLSSTELFIKFDNTAKSVAELQYKDLVWQPLNKHLSSESLPDSQKAARKLLLRAGDYF